MIIVIINHSKAYRNFKNQIGHANHFLITILVGLDGLEDHSEIRIRSSFHSSWNPKDRNVSITRSREFARNSALSWVVDGLDFYMRSCNTKPKLFSDKDLIKKFNDIGNSVYHRCKTIAEFTKSTPILIAFMELAITWRNNIIHSHANMSIDNTTREILLNNATEINDKFCNLDIKLMLDNFDKKSSPTFKETASLIKATIDFVTEVDLFLISNIDQNKYLNDVFNYYLSLQKNRDFFLAKLHNCPVNKQMRKLENILRQFGISNIGRPELENLLNSF